MENIQELYSRKQNLISFSATKINKLCIYLEKALYDRKKIYILGKALVRLPYKTFKDLRNLINMVSSCKLFLK